MLFRARGNIGNPGSGQRGTMDVVLEAMGWTVSDFSLASELKSSEQAQALCDNKVDAVVFTVGQPSGSMQEATSRSEEHTSELQSLMRISYAVFCVKKNIELI